MIKINIEKAKEITKDRLRAERTPLMTALDVEVMKNISNVERLSEIEVEKQKLRDATKVVDTMTTVDELKSISL